MIAAWLSRANNRDGIKDGPNSGFDLVLFEETDARNQGHTMGIREALRSAYRDPTYVAARVASGAFETPEDLYQAEVLPTSSSVRKGDFGEILGDFLIRSVESLTCEIPIKNVSNKENANLAARGFDYLGFKFQEVHGENVLVIGEAKYRSRRVSNIYLAGQVTLSRYSREREIQEVGKVAHLLHLQTRFDDMNRLARFSDGFTAKQEFERSHVLVVVHDSTANIASAIQKVKPVRNLKSLSILDVAIRDLDTLVDDAFSRG